MKKILADLKRGDRFRAAGIEWTVLETYNGKERLNPKPIHVVSSDIIGNRAFDERCCNDFSRSSIKRYLNGEFLASIEGYFPTGSIMDQLIYLTSDDGLMGYECDEVKVGLLTMYEYRKKRDILPPVRGRWWTATPFRSSNVCIVYKDGGNGNHFAHISDIGVRPTLLLNAYTEVEVDSEEDAYEKPQRQNDSNAQKRRAILDRAMSCVTGDRQEDHGSPEENFSTIANMWTEYLLSKGFPDCSYIAPHDVAAMMILLKTARIATGHGKQDNWCDIAGYAACGGSLEV